MTVRDWREVADEVFVRSYDQLDINICVVRAGEELLLVDSRSSPAEAAELADDLTAFAPARVQVLVNTHAHFDHTCGNQQFALDSQPPVTIVGHHRLPAHLDQYERPRLAAWRAGTENEPDRDWETLQITPPTQLVDVRRPLQIGDRSVELQPLGPGHTDTDLVVHVPDARTWIVGDVVEASGPPMYGSGCFPLRHPDQLAALLAQLSDDDVVVPGHGPMVDRAFVEAQLAEVVRFAAQLRAAHRSGETVEQALADPSRWPFPVDMLDLAARRAFAQLDQESEPTTEKNPPHRLPLNDRSPLDEDRRLWRVSRSARPGERAAKSSSRARTSDSSQREAARSAAPPPTLGEGRHDCIDVAGVDPGEERQRVTECLPFEGVRPARAGRRGGPAALRP